MGFHNTTHETGQQLIKFEKQTEGQDKVILDFFKKHEAFSFTPCECQSFIQLTGVPITSIRRSISDLTKKGLLIKTNKKKIGTYGRPNYTWKYNTKNV